MATIVARAINLDGDQLRQTANLVAANAQWLAIAAGFALGTNSNFDQRLVTDPPIVPAEYAFSIWGLIYPSAVAYSVYQALPAQRQNPLLREIGWYTASAYAAMTCWAFAAQNRLTWLTVVCMIWILVSLVGAFIQFLRFANTLGPNERRLVVAPISLHFGWITLATVVNVATALNDAGLRNLGLSPQAWAVAMLPVAGGVAAAVTQVSRGNPWYAGSVIWGLVGVAAANAGANRFVAVAAGGAAALVGAALARARLTAKK